MTIQPTSTDDPAVTTPPKGAYAHVNGLEMYYESHGAGRPLVLLHGGGHTIGLTFGAIVPALAATHQVIAVELQGTATLPTSTAR